MDKRIEEFMGYNPQRASATPLRVSVDIDHVMAVTEIDAGVNGTKVAIYLDDGQNVCNVSDSYDDVVAKWKG